MEAKEKVLDAASSVRVATTANFDGLVLGTARPVVVDFWAPWCVYCKKLAPIYEELAAEMTDVDFVKIDVDDQPAMKERFGITSLPTLKFFCAGREIGELVGSAPKDRLRAVITDMVETPAECLAASSAADRG